MHQTRITSTTLLMIFFVTTTSFYNLFEFAAGLYDAQLLSINGGTELLLYGGHQPHGLSNEIWKFTISTKTWELVAKMYKNRAEHVVLPISSFSC